MTTTPKPVDDGGPVQDMTLRDYFAAQALSGIHTSGIAKNLSLRLARQDNDSTNRAKQNARVHAVMARMAVQSADALIAVLKEVQP